jgi:tetratricopeptide (TPR) repeat protein
MSLTERACLFARAHTQRAPGAQALNRARTPRAPASIAAGRVAICYTSIAALLIVAPAARAQSPRPAEAALAEASRALAAGDADRAFLLGTDYLKRHPGDVRAEVLLIRAHLERGEWDAAYRMADRAAWAHPADVDVLYYLGLITRRLASDEFQRLMRIAPDSARVHQLQAEMLEAQEQRADAEKEYAAALQADPDLLDALLGLAKLKRIRVACDEAITLYEKAETIRPTFDAAYGLGVCHSQFQNHDAAVKEFQKAVERSPSAAVAWVGLGSSLVKLRRTAEGIAKLQRAIALEPQMYDAYYMLGVAYQASGDVVRAQNAFKKAEQLRDAR